MSREAEAAEASRCREGSLGPGPWRWALAAGWFPALGVGMTLSALADRLAFAGWGLAAALVYSWALRYGFEVGSPLTLGLLTAALAFFSLAWLVGRYQESLDLGYRAFLPGLYQSWILRPGVIAGLGFVSGWGAGLSWQRSREWRKSR